MSKFSEWKQYVTSPPPEVIKKIEYRSELLNALGIIFVCSILIYKGLWWAIFGIVFSIGTGWSRGMSAYSQYKIFMSFKPDETEDYILEDKSFTRRRQRLIKKVYPYMRWLILPSIFILAVGIIGFKKVTVDFRFRLWDITLFVWSNYIFQLFFLTIFLYFIFGYILVGGLIEKSKRDDRGKQTSSSTANN